MTDIPSSSSENSFRLGRELDYSKLKEEFYRDEENERFKYSIGNPYINDRIKRAEALDRVLYKGQWFMSGYIVSRLSRDYKNVYSQIIRIFPSHSATYLVALVDLECLPNFDESSQKFDARHFVASKNLKELLVPLSDLKFVDYTPKLDGYFQPTKMPSDQLELLECKRLQKIVDEERMGKIV